jgi:hypothetical protein
MSLILLQSTAVVISFGPFLDKTDGVTLEVGLVSAIDHATTGIFLSKNGGALTIRHATITASTYDAYGNYRVTLDATDTNTVGTLRVQFSEAATCLPVWQDFMVVVPSSYNLQVLSPAAVIQDAVWDADASDHVTANSTGLALGVPISGTADSGTTTTMVDAARTEADTDYWKGGIILFTSGTISGQARLITGFTPGSDTVTFAPATTQAVGTNTYKILPSGRADVQGWLGTTVATPTVDGVPEVDLTHVAGTTTSVSTLATTVGTNLDATVSSRASQSTLNTLDDFVDTEVAAIKAVTDLLPNAGALTTIQADLDDVQTRLPAALSGGRMSSDIQAINNNTAPVARFERSARSIVTGTASGVPTTTTIPATLSPLSGVNDQFKGRIVIFDETTTTTALRGQATDITAYTHATTLLTVTALTTAPVSGDTFVIV